MNEPTVTIPNFLITVNVDQEEKGVITKDDQGKTVASLNREAVENLTKRYPGVDGLGRCVGLAIQDELAKQEAAYRGLSRDYLG